MTSKASVRKASLTRGREAAAKRTGAASANGGGEPLVVYFDDIRLVRDLLGDYDANLAVLEDRLGVEAVVNGNAVALRGPDEAVDSGLEAEALLLLGEVYLKMKKYSEAREAFDAILRDYPRSPLVVQATNFLQYMKERGV